jgi:hypothetical protein
MHIFRERHSALQHRKQAVFTKKHLSLRRYIIVDKFVAIVGETSELVE